MKFIFPILSGLLLGISFLDTSLNFLAWFSLLPLFFFCDSKNSSPKRNFLAGLGAGFVFFGVILSWFFEALPLNWTGIESRALGFTLAFFAWLLSAGCLAIFPGLFGLFWSMTKRYKILFIPVFWIIFEYLRAWALSVLFWGAESILGGHWTLGNLGYLLSSNPNFLKLASFGGLYLLSFIVVFSNVLLYFLVKSVYRNGEYRKWGIIGLWALIFLVVFSYFVGLSPFLNNEESATPLRVAIIQTHRPSFFRQTREERNKDYNEQINLIKEAVSTGQLPRMIFFPEDSRFLSFSPEDTQKVLKDVLPPDKALLIVDSSRTETNVGIKSILSFFDTQKGILAQQEKIFLAPAGEYLPYLLELPAKRFFPDWVAKFEKSRGYKKGKETILAEFSGIKIGGFLCSEILSPEIYRKLSQEGAQILFNVASLAPFRGSRILDSQAQMMAKLRAAEANRYLVRATNYGSSYIVDNNGKIQVKTDGLGNQIVFGEVHPHKRKTFYTQYGDWILMLAPLTIPLLLVKRPAKRINYWKNRKFIFGIGILIILLSFLLVLGYFLFPGENYKIVNFHEHIESMNETQRLLQIMDENGVDKTILLAAPNYTFYLSEDMGFEEYEKNNEEILAVAAKYPQRFLAFVTLNPLDENNLGRLKNYVSRGAKGLKLWYGNGGEHGKGPFHVMKLDDPRMDSVFAYLEEEEIPLVFHVNLNKYYSEFVALMEKFPNLKIIVPHFMLSMWNEERLSRMEELFKKFPNLYTDISLGRPKFLIDGFKHISQNPELYRNFLIRNKDRFLFGTDIVITEEKFDSAFPVAEMIRAYQNLLEKKEFRLFFTKEQLPGLYLDKEILKFIYEINPARILGVGSFSVMR